MRLNLNIQSADPAHIQIARLLRQQIKTGVLKPNQALPTTTELARQCSVNPSTIQKTMSRLVADGLVVRSRKRGTFVRPQADRLVIGVLVGLNLADETAHYHRALIENLRLEIEERDRNWSCRLYSNIYSSQKGETGPNEATLFRLASDLKNYAFSGVVRFCGQLALKSLQLPKELPSVHILDSYYSLPKNYAPDVVQDVYRFGYETIDMLARRGMKRIAYLRTLSSVPPGPFDVEGIHDAVRFHSLPPIDIAQMPHTSGQQLEETAYQFALKLIAAWRRSRCWPQALLISDDIATRAASLALLSAEVPAGNRPVLVALTNEGIVHKYGLPVMRYEFSPRRTAVELIGLLQKRMAREPLPPLPIKIAGAWHPDVESQTKATVR